MELLHARGVKRILSVTYEILDESHLDLASQFRYDRIPLYDSLEQQGIQEVFSRTGTLLDQASKDQAPIYVHCHAGRSRSVLVVTAYLMHSRLWNWKRAYAHVVFNRLAASPNLGFIAELMAFERLLGLGSPSPSVSGGEKSPELTTYRTMGRDAGPYAGRPDLRRASFKVHTSLQ